MKNIKEKIIDNKLVIIILAIIIVLQVVARVYIGENSVVKNSILMEGCYIGNNCIVENAILDKQVSVSDGKHVSGEVGKPCVFKKRSTIWHHYAGDT